MSLVDDFKGLAAAQKRARASVRRRDYHKLSHVTYAEEKFFMRAAALDFMAVVDILRRYEAIKTIAEAQSTSIIQRTNNG